MGQEHCDGRAWDALAIVLVSILLSPGVSPAQAQTFVQDCESGIETGNALSVPLQRGPQGHLTIRLDLSGQPALAVIDTAALGIGGLISGDFDDRLSESGVAGPALEVHGAHGGGALQSRILDVTVEGGPASSGQLFLVTDDFPLPEAELILGSRFLCQFLLEIDLAGSKLTFLPRESARPPGGEWTVVPFEDVLGSGGIAFEMTVEGRPVPAVLDTGSPFSAINWAAAESAGIDRDSPEMVEQTFPPHGLMGGEPVIASVVSADLALPGNRLARRDADLRISDAPVFEQLFQGGPGLLLGFDFLEGRRIRIDRAQGLLLFQ